MSQNWQGVWRVGDQVLLEGHAVDSKAGAVLLSLDRVNHIGILGMDAWPSSALDRKLRLRGTIAVTDDLPVFIALDGDLPLPPGATWEMM
jgi:hypothetical protein